jgi:hypothetical protein
MNDSISTSPLPPHTGQNLDTGNKAHAPRMDDAPLYSSTFEPLIDLSFIRASRRAGHRAVLKKFHERLSRVNFTI